MQSTLRRARRLASLLQRQFPLRRLSAAYEAAFVIALTTATPKYNCK
jgi:hypothetical protein